MHVRLSTLKQTGGWQTLPRGTGVNPCTIKTRGGADSFLRFLQKRFGF
jgi:hypothetical protein